MAGGDEFRIYVEKLAQALQHNMPPPPIPADMPPGAVSEIDMLLAGLGMAGNSGDPKDTATGQADLNSAARRPARPCRNSLPATRTRASNSSR